MWKQVRVDQTHELFPCTFWGMTMKGIDHPSMEWMTEIFNRLFRLLT